jgi:hypothetical protein
MEQPMKALVDISLRRVLSVFDGTIPADLPRGQVAMRLVDEPATYNAETQTRVFDRYEIAGAKVTRIWTVAAKTPAQIYAEHLAAGYVDAVTGYKLKTGEYDTMKFTQQLVRLNSKLQNGDMLPTDLQSFWDFNDVEHELPAAEMVALLDRYGDFCTELFNTYAP